MKNLILPIELAHKIVEYIMSQPSPARPVGDAVTLLQALQQLQPIQEQEKEQ